MELETYRMRNKNTLVLDHMKEGDRYEVTIYLPSDIEERTWTFFFEDEAQEEVR